MTLIELARQNKTSDIVIQAAKDESVDQAYLLKHIASGEIVIPLNNSRYNKKIKACAIGTGLRTKVNANIGMSSEHSSLDDEIEKLHTAIDAGVDAVMDLSTGGNLQETRARIISESTVPVGTVPVYDAAVAAYRKYGAITKMSKEDMFKALENQAKEGVDFFTIHCGITKESLERLIKQERTIDIVSRGGSFLAEWIKKNNKENPYYENFDEIINIAKKYDIALSLGDGMRPGSIMDATDRPQIQELILLGELAAQAHEAGVQVMIEGPGHVPLNQIEANVILQKKLCNNKPFYVLGPLVTDVAPGYDHITSAIGGAIAGAAGADFLCYVTPSEHLGLPNLEDVYDGVIASRIAAHAADIAKGVKGAVDWDKKISEARKKRDWLLQEKLSIAPKRFAKIRKKTNHAVKDNCTMCGEFCSMKVAEG